jgi:hypothetical protein
VAVHGSSRCGLGVLSVTVGCKHERSSLRSRSGVIQLTGSVQEVAVETMHKHRVHSRFIDFKLKAGFVKITLSLYALAMRAQAIYPPSSSTGT